MATTAQEVFEMTMSIMDELSDTGAADIPDTEEYKNRTKAILNVLGGELFPYSDNYAIGEVGKRPIFSPIEDLEDEIALDDYCCRTVMPYGLAAHLLLDENPNAASFCQQRYEELKAELTRWRPQESEDVYDVYGPNGGLWPHNEFGFWR